MSSRCVSQKLSSCEDEEKRIMDCVYCKQRGPFLKNGVMMWGKHHVMYCCKADDRKKVKRNANRRKSTFIKEEGGWRRKSSVKNNTRVTSGAKTVLEMSQDASRVLCVMDAEAESKRLKESERKKISAAAAAKKAPRPSTKKPAALGGWLAVAKAKKPVVKKESKVEIPLVASPKRVDALKKQAKAKLLPTVFKKDSVMSFEEMANIFAKTDSWGDSSDEC